MINGKISLSETQLPLFKNSNAIIPAQFDDLNKDGKWDEVVLLFDFKANETIVAKIQPVLKNEYPAFEKRTNLNLGIEQNNHSFVDVDDYHAIPYI